MSFLDRIRPAKKREVAALRESHAERAPQRTGPEPRDLAAALADGPRLIAELKRHSPSDPVFEQTASFAGLAGVYNRAGAAAISIVTDHEHFGASLADVGPVRQAAPLPVLVKDFVLDEVQIDAAWAAGADAVLLIARFVEPDVLARLLNHVHARGLSALVECHDGADIDASLAAGARIIGLNNRDLARLTTDLALSERFLPRLPADVVKVCESGLDRREDIVRLTGLGADAFLIGHAILKHSDPGLKIRRILGTVPAQAPLLKVCGLTSPADATAAREAGADILGVIFADSPRQVTADQAAEVGAGAPDARLCGVFRNHEIDEIIATANTSGLDLLQLHGDESPDFCRELRERTGLPVIKVLETGSQAMERHAEYDTAYLLLDRPKDAAGVPDGSVDPELVATAARLREAGHSVFIAGGLDPSNVASTLAAAPAGVDVCRGVESAPGRKDPERLRAFSQEIRP